MPMAGHRHSPGLRITPDYLSGDSGSKARRLEMFHPRNRYGP